MSESAGKSSSWASDWIAQQRKKFERAGSASDGAEDPTNVFGSFFQNALKDFQIPPTGGQARGFGPAVGLMRGHEQAWRDLAEAQVQYRQLEAAVLAQLNAVQLEALTLLEQRVRERNEPIAEMRELYDLWIECGEEIYARCVRSESYCTAQAALANAASELRLKQQVILDRALRMFDLPTRSELNSVHRQLREIKERLDALSTQPVQAAAASSESVGGRTTTRRKSATRRKSS